MIYSIGEEPKTFHHPSPRFVCMVRVEPRYKKAGDLGERILLIQQDGKLALPSGKIDQLPVHAMRTFLEKNLGFLPSTKEFGGLTKHYYVMNDDGNFLYVLSEATLDETPRIKMGEAIGAYMWAKRSPFLNLQLIPGEDVTLGSVYGVNPTSDR